MKKALSIALILSAITVGVAVSSPAAVVEKDEGYISSSASSTTEVSPNQAEITINIETSDLSFQKASQQNKNIAQKVYSSLNNILNTAKGDYIKTGNYSANPIYSYTKDNKRVFDKYVVTNSIVVRTKNTDVVPKLIDTAIAQGATNVNDLQFFAADYDDRCSDILSDLTKKTYNQASAVAASINQKIVGTKSINLTCNPENNSRPVYKMMATMDSAGASSTPIESGKIKIYANVDASYYVK